MTVSVDAADETAKLQRCGIKRSICHRRLSFVTACCSGGEKEDRICHFQVERGVEAEPIHFDLHRLGRVERG